MDKFSLKPLTCSFEYLEQIPVIVTSGDITSDSEEILTRYFDKALASDCTVIAIEFRESFYINSSGIVDLLKLFKKVSNSGKKTFIYLPNEYFNTIFQIIGLYEIAPPVMNKEELLKLIHSNR
ncbi:MAG: STAS domain-containing protein [Spirochaetes bacterium]|nr:STAS domain-containing protein [Spirochaetota bacterium]